MKKITFLTLHLGFGGVENALTVLSNTLIDNYDIEIISVYKRNDVPVFKLNKKIKIKYLINHADIKLKNDKNCFKFLKNLIFKVKDNLVEHNLVKKAINNCDSDIIISTNIKYNSIIGKYAKAHVVKICWEHRYHDNNQKYIKKVLNSLENIDYFVVVSKLLQEFYAPKINSKKCNCIYIPNALEDIPDDINRVNNKNIVAVGKLSKEKGYVDLIEIFKYVSLKCPDWQLNIIGDGIEKGNIEERIKTYKLENNVILYGFKDKNFVKKMLQKSSIYVMCSMNDAFGISILEAFSYGIPCVAFDTSLGAKELISNNWDGYLISNLDKERMSKKIIDLIKNENRRFIMGDNAYKKSLKYRIDVIKEKWLEILN